MKPHVSHLKMLRNEAVGLEIVPKQNVSTAFEEEMKRKKVTDAFVIRSLLLPKTDS